MNFYRSLVAFIYLISVCQAYRTDPFSFIFSNSTADKLIPLGIFSILVALVFTGEHKKKEKEDEE